jgi:hydroxylaminobenzene mutase
MISPSPLQRTLMFRAALLFALGMVTGLWVAVVLTHGQAAGITLPPVKYERLALAAHLNALMGTFWLLGLASTIEHTSFTDAAKARLALLSSIAAYGNWGVTLLASFLDVRGLDFGGDLRNKLVAGLLQALVVIPTLLSSGLWAYGLRPRK